MVVSTFCSGHLQTRWWTPWVRETVKLKSEFYRALLAGRMLEAFKEYQQAKWTTALAVVEAKTWMWDELVEALDKDSQWTPRTFW